MKKVKYPAIIASILSLILYLEGGYSNNPNDPGGETKYGITERVARDYGYTGSMIDLTEDEAKEIYYVKYISEPNFTSVIEVSEPVGTKLIDIGVNTGIHNASKWYQLTLNNFSRGCLDYPCVKVDGILGSASIEAFNNLIGIRGYTQSCKLMLRGLNTYQGIHYFNLKSLSTFTVGWFTNRINNVEESECEK